MNIFEGARRISKIIYAGAILIGAMLLTSADPFIHRYYSFQENGELKQVDACDGGPSFRADVEGRPSWASLTVCGWGEGPKTVPLNKWELEKLDDAIYLARFERYGEILFGTFASVVGLFILFWCIGWIVRGFLGIPRGQDYRVTPMSAQK